MLERTLMWMIQGCMLFFMVLGGIGIAVKNNRDRQSNPNAEKNEI